KILEAQEHLPGSVFQQLASYTSIKDPLKSAIGEYITFTQTVAPDKFDDTFYEADGILFELAKNGLIEKSCIQLVIKSKLTDWLGDADNFEKGCEFFRIFSKIQFIEQSWILDFNLIPKLLQAQKNLETHGDYMLDLLRVWMPQFPEIIPHFLEQMLEFFYNEKASYIVSELLWMLNCIIEDGLIDLNLIREFKLVEKLATGIASYLSQDVEDSEKRFLSECNLVNIFETFAKKDLLTQSILLEFQIIKQLFSQTTFNPEINNSWSNFIETFFHTLINKSLITKAELIEQSVSYLSLTDIPDDQKRLTQSNVIMFLEFSLPIDKELVKEHQLIEKLFKMYSLFDRDSKEGKALYHLFAELSK
ncbi:MAG: hypothetical protein C5B43_02595, partial [Verrucomicrobia bacterium]